MSEDDKDGLVRLQLSSSPQRYSRIQRSSSLSKRQHGAYRHSPRILTRPVSPAAHRVSLHALTRTKAEVWRYIDPSEPNLPGGVGGREAWGRVNQ